MSPALTPCSARLKRQSGRGRKHWFQGQALLVLSLLHLCGCAQALGLDTLSFEDDEQEPKPSIIGEVRDYPAQLGNHQLIVGRPDGLSDAPYLVYDPSSGSIQGHRANPSSKSYEVVEAWQWERQWSLVLQVPRLDGTMLLGYDGEFGLIERVPIDAQGARAAAGERLVGSVGWSHLVPIEFDGEWYILAYNHSTGHYRFGRAWPELESGGELLAGVWSNRWTSFTAHRVGEAAGVLKYDSQSGDAELEQLTGSNRSTFTGNLGSGATSILSFSNAGEELLLVYYANGVVVVGSLDSSAGLSFVPAEGTIWREALSQVTRIELESEPYAVTYIDTTGVAQLHTLSHLEPLPVF